MSPRRRTFPWVALWLALILLAGAGLRVAYLTELRQAPDFTEPLADAAFHDYWARGMVTGDWTPPGNEPNPRIPEAPYLRPPGYPFFLAALYRVFGVDPLVPRIAQMALGLLNVALAFLFGRRVLGRTAGLILAAFTATYWGSIYFEGELQAPVLLQTTAWIALLLLASAGRGAARWAPLVAGLSIGAAAVVRANALLFVPAAALWLLWVLRRRGVPAPSAIGSAALVVAGAVAVVAPVTVRNYRVSGEFVPVSVNGAVNLYIGNNETADGTSATIPDLEKLSGRPGWNWFRYSEIVGAMSRQSGFDLTYGDVSREFTQLALEWIRANPGTAAKLAMKRALLFWGPDEISNNKAISMEKENSRLLAPFPAFPIVLAVMLLGIGLVILDVRAARRGERRPSRDGPEQEPDGAALLLVGLFVGVIWLSYAPFLVAARFRVPLVPALFVFGAWGIYRVVVFARQRNAWAAVLSLVAVGLLIPALGISAGENQVDRAWWHTDRGVALKRQMRQDEARREFELALEANPGYIDAHVQLGDLLHENGDENGAIRHYNAVFQERPDRTDLLMKSAVILMEQQRFQEAAVLLQQAAQIVPDSPDVHFEFGRALVELGKNGEGAQVLTRSLEIAPGSVPALINRGLAYTRQERWDDAIADLESAVELNPYSQEAFYWLGHAYAGAGSEGLAMEAFREAARIGLTYVEPRVEIGNLHNRRGEWDEAIAAYEDALRIDPDHTVVRFNLAGSLANAGRLGDAADVLETALETAPNDARCRERLQQIRQMIEAQTSAPGR